MEKHLAQFLAPGRSLINVDDRHLHQHLLGTRMFWPVTPDCLWTLTERLLFSVQFVPGNVEMMINLSYPWRAIYC